MRAARRLTLICAGLLLLLLSLTAHVSAQYGPQSATGIGLLAPIAQCADYDPPAPAIAYDRCNDAHAIAYTDDITASNATIVVASENGLRTFGYNAATQTVVEYYPGENLPGDDPIAVAYVNGEIVVVMEQATIHSCAFEELQSGYVCVTRATHTANFAIATIDLDLGYIFIMDVEGVVVFTRLASWALSTCDPSATSGNTPTFALHTGYAQIDTASDGVMYAGSTNGMIVTAEWVGTEASLTCDAVPAGCCGYRGIIIDEDYGNLVLFTQVGIIVELEMQTLTVNKLEYVPMGEPVFSLFDPVYRQAFVGTHNGGGVDSTIYRFDVDSLEIVDSFNVAGYDEMIFATFGATRNEIWASQEDANPGGIAYLSSHDCSAHAGCASCSVDAYCYWCLELGSCMERSDNLTACPGSPAEPSQCAELNSLSVAVSSYDTSKTITATGSGFTPAQPEYQTVCVVEGVVPVNTSFVSDSEVVCVMPPLRVILEALEPPVPDCPFYNSSSSSYYYSDSGNNTLNCTTISVNGTNSTSSGNMTTLVNCTAANSTFVSSYSSSSSYYCLPDNPPPPVDESFTTELRDVTVAVGFLDDNGVARPVSGVLDYGYYNCSAFTVCEECLDVDLRPDCGWCMTDKPHCALAGECDPVLHIQAPAPCPSVEYLMPSKVVAYESRLLSVVYSSVPYSTGPHAGLDDELFCIFSTSASLEPNATVSVVNATVVSSTTVQCYSPPLPKATLYVAVSLYGVPIGKHFNTVPDGWDQQIWTTSGYQNFEGAPSYIFVDDEINYSWGSGEIVPGVANDFSVRWTGYFSPPQPDNYYFCVTSDDGGRIRLDGTEIANIWWNHGNLETCSTLYYLDAPVELVYEMYEDGGGATAQARFAGGPYAKSIIPLDLIDFYPPANLVSTLNIVDCNATSCETCAEGVEGCGWCYTTSTCINVVDAALCPLAGEFVTAACPKLEGTEPPFHDVQAGAYDVQILGQSLANVANLTCRYTFPTSPGNTPPQYFPAVYVNSSLITCPSPNGTYYVNETEVTARGPPPGFLEFPVVGPATLDMVIAEPNVTVTYVLNTTATAGNGTSCSGNGTAPGNATACSNSTGGGPSYIAVEVTGPPLYVPYSDTSVELPMYDCGAGLDTSYCYECLGSGTGSAGGYYEACGWCPNSHSCAPSSLCEGAYGIPSMSVCPTYIDHSPTTGSVDGQTVLRIAANGFPILASSGFECVFSDSQRTTAAVVSTTIVECLTPAASTGPASADLHYLDAPFFVTPTNDPPAPMAFTYYDCGVEGSCAECSAAAAASKPECGWCVDAAACESVAAAQCPDFWIDSLFSSMSQDCPAWTGPATLMSGDVSGGTLVSLTADAVVLSTMHDYTCVFEGVGNSSATAVSTTQLNCYSPPAPGGAVSVDVSVMYGDAVWADGFAGSFEYYNCTSLSCATCVTDTNYTECEYCKSADACVPYSCPEGPATLDQCYYSSTTVTSEIEQLSGTGNVAPPDTGKGSVAIIVSAVVAGFLFCVVVVIFAVREYQSHQRKKRESFEPPKLTPHVIQALCFGSITPLTIAEEELLVKASSLRTLLVKDADRDPPFLLFNVLCDAMRPADGDKFARSIIHLAEDCGGLGEALIKARISHEMATTEHINTVFRTNSLATKMFRTYSKLIGMPYVHSTLGYTLNEALASAGNVEVDANKLANGEDEVLNRWTLMMTTQKVSNAIFSSVSAVPPSLRRILGHVQREFADRFGGLDANADEMFEEMVKEQLELAYSSYRECLEAFTSIHSSSDFDDHKRTSVALENLDESVGGAVEELKKLRETVTKLEAASDPTSEAAKSLMAEAERTNNSIAVGGFFFLRFIVPAITAPESYGMVKTAPSPESRRLLILVSKVIQNLSNNKFFGAKEGYMLKMNSWITENLEKVHTLFESITSYHGDGVDSIHIPSVCVDVAMVTILRNIENNMGNILATLDGLADEDGMPSVVHLGLLDELESCLRDDTEVSARSEISSMRGSFMARSNSATGAAIMASLPNVGGNGDLVRHSAPPTAPSAAALGESSDTDKSLDDEAAHFLPHLAGAFPDEKKYGSARASFMIDDDDLRMSPAALAGVHTQVTQNAAFAEDLELSSDDEFAKGGSTFAHGDIPLKSLQSGGFDSLVPPDVPGESGSSGAGVAPRVAPPSRPPRPSVDGVGGGGGVGSKAAAGKPAKPPRPGSQV